MKYPFSDMYGERTKFGSRTPKTDPSQMARDWMGQAAGTYGRMQSGSKTKTEGPGKTTGGAIYSAGGGAVAGSALGSALGGASAGSSGGWWGAGIGFVLGLGSYLLS